MSDTTTDGFPSIPPAAADDPLEVRLERQANTIVALQSDVARLTSDLATATADADYLREMGRAYQGVERHLRTRVSALEALVHAQSVHTATGLDLVEKMAAAGFRPAHSAVDFSARVPPPVPPDGPEPEATP